MAAFNEYSIGNLASSISRNKVLLTDLFLSNEPVYYSQLSGDRYKGCNITELIDLHLVDVPGKEIVTLTPEFRELISKAFNIVRIVTDHDVMRYKEKLEQDIEDYHTAHDYRRACVRIDCRERHEQRRRKRTSDKSGPHGLLRVSC